jgi:hypothetical protein
MSFLENTPQAINLTMLRPYPRDVHHILSLASIIEMYLLFLFFLLFLWKRIPGTSPNNLLLFCLFFAFSMLLAIGFSNNNIGAISRYRSVVMPLLIIPMIARIDWQGIKGVFTTHK